jgi:hypothetical protein
MSTTRIRRRVASLVGVIVMLLPASIAIAQEPGDRNPPIEVTFTKWATGNVFVPDSFGITEGRRLMKGITGGDIPGTFVGEVLQGQPSAHPDLKAGINKLEAIYEVDDVTGNHVFTALIRGGTNRVTGAALLDGIVLAGWRVGAPVHVEFQTIPGAIGCANAPPGVTCFEGTIRIGRAPQD